MKKEFSLEVVNHAGSPVLAQLGHALHAVQPSLECFVWSEVPESGEARVWIIFSEGASNLPELAAILGRIPCVRRVTIHGPGHSIKETLI